MIRDLGLILLYVIAFLLLLPIILPVVTVTYVFLLIMGHDFRGILRS